MGVTTINNIVVSILTSLIVSLITFTLGMKSGKNQADRQRLKELYKNITVHFQNIKLGLESCKPKTWSNYTERKGESNPLIKRMVVNGDIIEINNNIAKRAEKIEKESLVLGWRLYDNYKNIYGISIDIIKKYVPLHYERNGNNYCTKKPDNSTGRSFREIELGVLLDKNIINEKLSSSNENIGFNFKHNQDGKILYSITIYPEDLMNISIKDLLYEINDAIFDNVENMSDLIKQKKDICRDISKIIKITRRRAKDPHTFIETIGGAFIDIFKF